tara:strand:- start:1309 stop:1479 length:171 start_codon:yes stop_codon:yes gene_type:complete
MDSEWVLKQFHAQPLKFPAIQPIDRRGNDIYRLTKAIDVPSVSKQDKPAGFDSMRQ